MKSRLAIGLILTLALAVGLGSPARSADKLTTGLAKFNSGRWAESCVHLLAAVSQNPNDVVTRLTAGVALANVKRYEQALQQFKAASRLAPSSAVPQLLLAGTYSEMGRTVESGQARVTANRMLSMMQAPSKLGKSDRALASALEEHPNNAVARCLLGDLYQLQGKLDAAREQYVKASDLAPKWPKPVFNLGLANLPVDPKAAEEDFARAIELDPSNSRAYLWRGDAYLKQGRFDQAVAAYQKAGTDPTLAAEAQTRIGNAQMQAGNYQAAFGRFDLAARQDPQDPRPLAGAAQVLQKMGKAKEAESKYAEAADVLAANRAPASSQAVVQNQLGAVQAQQGRYQDAASNFQEGFELHPTMANAEALAKTQQKADLLNLGIARYELVLRKDPGRVPAMLYLLSAYKINGNAAGAAEMAARLAKTDPSNAPAYYADLGAARMAMGDTPKALEAYSLSMETGSAVTWPDTVRSAAACGLLGLLETRYQAAFAENESARSIGLILLELQSAQDGTAALETAKKLAKAHPDDSLIWLRLGEVYEKTGDKDAAKQAYRRVLIGSDSTAAALARARLQVIAGK